MSEERTFSLLAAVCDFGWGSLGKLRLILDNLPPTRVALYGDAGINALTREMLGAHHEFSDHPPQQSDVAVVINDPAAANAISALAVPVIYVDSLPYLWMTEAEIPSADATAFYCAQKFPMDLMPVASPLRARRDIRWVDPIVPAARGRRGGRGVVISLGGLHSHLVGDTTAAYVSLVLFPLIEALSAGGRRIAAVCGNLDAGTREKLAALLPDCRAIGPQTPYAFERLLKDADLLVTSPGSTTILQAIAIDLPTLLLPPQNLSQIFNARLYSRPGADFMSWPVSVLDPARVEELRPHGEDAVLAYIYGSIAEAAVSPQRAREVAVVIGNAVRDASAEGMLDRRIIALGSSGANQVAQLIKQVLFAPLRRQPTSAVP